MKSLSKLIFASLVLSLPLTMVACDDGGDDGNGGGAGGDTNGSSGGSGNGSGGRDGSGGNGQGGESPDGPPFTVADCLAEDGPNSKVTGSKIGAFKDDASWLEGWTNFSANSTPEDDGSAPDVIVNADIATNTTWTADNIYSLQGEVHVLDGATLTIEAGTLIKSATDGTLIVSRGGKINAVGTKDAPIVFTSLAANGSKAQGQWGGLVLLGRASNWRGADVDIEGLASLPLNQYGPGAGNDPIEDDNSGELKYVRLEFGGTELQDGNEINGLTMGSVGSGTKISYVMVSTTLDDGFEWFGGSVSADHLVINDEGDDMLDTDQGYTGTIDTVFGRQIDPVKSDPNGLEWDSDLSDRQPVTNVTLKNATLCGTGDVGNPNYGAVLREKVIGTIDNVAFVGFDAGFDIRDDFGTAAEPNITITNSYSWDHLDGVAYDETDTSEGCSAGAEPWLCDNDFGFDEIEWFRSGAGNVDFQE